ncbi:MAG: HAD-IIIA family hydrolase [Syntrophobacterales bacterium]|nr:MAG: HAD-IIIA family hydrolase [Syntrophobacterales bacterium]
MATREGLSVLQRGLEKAKNVKLLILDVDGVLTDGRIVIDDRGVETKCFDVRDGHGIKLLKRANIEVVIITGRKSHVVSHRARELGIDSVYQNIHDKLEVYQALLDDKGLKDEEVGFMGDDLVDLPLMKRVGFSAVVADGIEDLKSCADYISRNRGGRGAVREISELILKAQGKWAEVMERYLR